MGEGDFEGGGVRRIGGIQEADGGKAEARGILRLGEVQAIRGEQHDVEDAYTCINGERAENEISGKKVAHHKILHSLLVVHGIFHDLLIAKRHATGNYTKESPTNPTTQLHCAQQLS